MELTTDIDQLNGQFKGTGRVRIKAHTGAELDALKQKLDQLGISMDPHEEQIKKKSNYTNSANVPWNDGFLQKEERRCQVNNNNNNDCG